MNEHDRTQSDDYLTNPDATPDEEITRLESSLRAVRHRGGVDLHPPSRRGPSTGVLLIFALLAVAVLAINITGQFSSRALPLSGIEGMEQLRPGQWIEPTSKARIDLDDMGEVTIEPDSRLRLLKSTPREHRLELARGSIEAFVTAPPRMFFVETPSALAVDLGCAYTLDVDDTGAGVLQVTLGWVALEKHGRTSTVPAGASCQMSPKTGPGTPVFDDATDEFRNAVALVDAEPALAIGLDEVLRLARARDSLTIYHLIPALSGEKRAAATDRLIALVEMPEQVTREGTLALDDAQMYRWWNAVQRAW